MDLATREVVGYAMADHHRAELVVDALDMAHGRSGLEPGCVIHSDRGSEGGFNRSSQYLHFGGVQDRYGGLEQEDRRCA
ncbi:DDE-type integrase/transposase/recombinase [Streptomyces sp. NPDC127084]|uniref:DDE-type integrase/transposase/recombinase n=1 Tax=Streptomyces sp. NPDC127084 TaxID=3347133 RepID=UPI003664011B